MSKVKCFCIRKIGLIKEKFDGPRAQLQGSQHTGEGSYVLASIKATKPLR